MVSEVLVNTDRLGYPADRAASLPDVAVESFACVGNPFTWGEPAAGNTVLDLGSGAGFDALLAAQASRHRGVAAGIFGVVMLDQAARFTHGSVQQHPPLSGRDQRSRARISSPDVKRVITPAFVRNRSATQRPGCSKRLGVGRADTYGR
jgi:hypothetical protein